MPVGILELDLYIPECTSLKEKRVILKGLKDKVRSRFNVSVAEVDGQDLWQRSRLLVAVAASDTRGANRLLSKVVNFVERERGLQLLDYSLFFV